MNNFLQFYRENKISPVSQDIKDLNLHYNRRIGLYRSLGLSSTFFKDRDVLEVAPGSGYNSIVTATFGMKSYDLIEPNLTGFDMMVRLFEEYQVRRPETLFFNVRLEDFSAEKKYDIVLCEGLIPGLVQGDIFLEELQSRVKSGGILVITGVDAISSFFETLRRYLSRILISRSDFGCFQIEKDAKQAVMMLSECFQSHLHSLKGMSRPVEDWVYDNLLNPASASLAAKNEFSIERCLKILGDRYYFLGSSPVFMNNWNWYKDLPSNPHDYNEPFVNSYKSLRHNLLNYQETSQSHDYEGSEEMYRCCKAFALKVEMREPLSPGNFTSCGIQTDLSSIRKVKELAGKYGLRQSATAIHEFIDLFDGDKIPTSQIISDMREFRVAFGRGQQYISLVKA